MHLVFFGSFSSSLLTLGSLVECRRRLPSPPGLDGFRQSLSCMLPRPDPSGSPGRRGSFEERVYLVNAACQNILGSHLDQGATEDTFADPDIPR